MPSLIPVQFRLAAAVAALVAAFAAGGMAGATVATWRAEAGFSGERQACATAAADQAQQITDMRVKITEQNGKVALLEADTKAAETARDQAQQFADTLAAFSKSRMDKLQSALAQSCGDVTRNYWELRK